VGKFERLNFDSPLRSNAVMSSASTEQSMMRSPNHHSSSVPSSERDLWQWHVNMTGMEAHLQRVIVVLMLARTGDAMVLDLCFFSLPRTSHTMMSLIFFFLSELDIDFLCMLVSKKKKKRGTNSSHQLLIS
jgi:hypothetical protein